MSLFSVLLISLSALVHVGWNYLGKSSRSTPAAFLVASLAGALLLLPVVILLFPTVARMPSATWGLLAATGFFQALYYTALSRAYDSGELSVAYPLLRSLPIVIVTTANLVAGRVAALPPLVLVGFSAIVAGSLLLPLGRFRDLSLRSYLHPTILFVVLAAAGTSGYSLIDSSALEDFRSALSGPAAPLRAALVYSFFEALSSALWLVIPLISLRSGRSSLRAAFTREGLGGAFLMGIGISIAYTLVLASMGFVVNVSYVVAFRQLSIPLGVVAGITLLGEGRCAPKLTGTALMVIGLVLSAVGGGA